jgi:hypothetical protein
VKVRVACACKRAGTLLDHPSFDMNDGLYFVGTVRPCDFTVCTPLSRLFGAHNSTNTRYLRRQKVLRVVVRSGFNGFSAVDALTGPSAIFFLKEILDNFLSTGTCVRLYIVGGCLGAKAPECYYTLKHTACGDSIMA